MYWCGRQGTLFSGLPGGGCFLHTHIHSACRRRRSFETMMSVVAAAAASVMSACLCPNQGYCMPLTTPLATTEVVAFAPRVGAWKDYDMNALTTIMKFGDLSDVPELICKAHAANVRVAYSKGFDKTKLNDSAAIAAFAKEVTATVTELYLDGFNFDQEGNGADADGLTMLVKAVSESLRAANPLAQISFDSGIYGNPASGYNLGAIAPHIDFFIPMAYDMCWGTKTAEPNSPIAGDVMGVEVYKKMGLLDKTVLGLPWYGWNFPCKTPAPAGGCPVVTPFGGGAWQLCFDNALELEKNATVKANYTRAADARFFSYESNGVTHQVYYDDASTLTRKYDLVNQFGLRGVAVWYAGCATSNTPEAAAMWKAVATVKKQ
eukprot:TRINITY_DN25764_c0_g1_i1.p1 TRINITY_DN25764_c0_g1~~TRINITY_DN25764_c0_g1_i1.p1  ORF type:complete len:377 (+),score=97.08 TRINITY_DN25764_c0_g1_i1:555-1685(+)